MVEFLLLNMITRTRSVLVVASVIANRVGLHHHQKLPVAAPPNVHALQVMVNAVVGIIVNAHLVVHIPPR